MVDFERYIEKLREYGWEFEQNLADNVRRRGYSPSDVLFVKAVLRDLIEGEDGPLAGMELRHDAYEMTILGKVIDRIIDENL